MNSSLAEDEFDDAMFCSPEEFYGPSLTTYYWIDENLTLNGYAGLDMQVTARTLFWNFLDTNLRLSLPEDMPLDYLVSDNDEDWMSPWYIVPTANLPFEVEVNYVDLTPGNIEYVLALQVEAVSPNGTVLCELPSANITCVIVAMPQEYNHLGSLLVVGWTMLAIIWTLCATCLLWMYAHRSMRAVKVLQPLFLNVITVGVAVIGASIIPLSLTDENVSLKVAEQSCQATPWLLVLGFTLVFSAFFSKLWRINKIFQGAHHMRKLKVTERDVMWPFLFWFILNCIILTLRTWLAPAKFERVAVDGFPADTVATCKYDGALSVSLYLANLAVTLSSFFAAAYQAYRARNISDEYSEGKSLWMAMFIWIEIMAIGVPVIILVGFDSPTTSYFVMVAMIFGLCLSMLGAIYVPLYRQVRKHHVESSEDGVTSVGGGEARSVKSYGAGRTYVSGIRQEASSQNSGGDPHHLSESPRMSIALGAKPEHILKNDESATLLQKVADLEAQIARLQQRNQELESLVSHKVEEEKQKKSVDDDDI